LKQHFSYSFLILLLLVVLASCSRKNDSFISRNLHAVGTEFNTLYNGNLALQAGLDNIEANYQDNYWDILPVERLAVRDQIVLSDSEQSDPNFQRAEEKAVKAVQKHSMLIDGVERNPQIDDAYMLLGKARYYDQRFIQSIEAFNYILQFMPESDKNRLATIWREKTNMRLDNNEIAIENLQELVSNDTIEMEREELILANATLAQAYLNVDKIDSALIYMNRAANKTKNRATEGRYKFIAGQLFARAGQRDSAIVHFDEVIELHRKIPRDYYVRAFIEKIKLRDSIQDDDQLLAILTELEENRENRPWLDLIYSRKGIYYEGIDSLDAAIASYNQSLRAGNFDAYLRGNTYSSLGSIYFDKARFETAGNYYDSAIAQYEDKSREQRAITKKRENLADIILYESNRRSADSLLSLLAMTDQEREDFYNNYIEELKERDQQLAEQAAIQEANLAQQKTAQATVNTANKLNGNRGFGPPGIPVDNASASRDVQFYFYVPTTVARGKLEFRAQWGNRRLEDNWRLQSLSGGPGSDLDDNVTSTSTELTPPEYLASYYIDQLPDGTIAPDSISDARDFAYYQLGVLYKEKFKRPDLAVNRFETLLTYDPEERLLLPTLYNLYLLGRDDPAFAKAEQYKNLIISDYPGTRYAQILQNPDTDLTTSDSPDAVYKQLYRNYEQGNYLAVIDQANQEIVRYSGDPIVPKIELLKAYASGRIYGFNTYKEGLDYVALNYPGSEEGKQAESLAADAARLKIPEAFMPEDNLTSFKLLYRIDRTDQSRQRAISNSLEEQLQTYNSNLSYSIDAYSPEYSLVVIHGFKTQGKAIETADALADPSRSINLPETFLPIATENYKVVQVYKSLQDYESQMQ
jgi:tetratricopeptide (TPR) repeat protein